MSTPSQREIVQDLVYKHRLETESAYVIATRLIEGAEEFRAALITPSQEDTFTLKDPDLNSLVNLAADLATGLGTQETGMEFLERLKTIEDRLNATHEIAKEFREAIPTRDGEVLAAMIEQGVTVLGSHISYAVSSMYSEKPIAYANENWSLTPQSFAAAKKLDPTFGADMNPAFARITKE